MSAAQVVYVATVDLSIRFLLLDQLLDLQWAGFEVSAACAAGAWAEEIRAAGIPLHEVPLRRRISPLADVAALVRLTALFRRLRPAIVHTHTPKANLLGRLAARLAGVPVVAGTEHGFYFFGRGGLARRFWVTLARVGAAWSDVLFLINEEDVRTAAAEGIGRPGQVVHLAGGVGVDVERFRPGAGNGAAVRRALGLPGDVPVAGMVGRLDEEKGLGDLLRAAAVVRRDLAGCRFLVVGPADRQDETHYRDLASSLGIGEAVTFAGMRTDMPDVYAAMDVLCLPSRREGLPVVLMEAAAMGLPAVASDIRGCQDAVVDGVTGLLVPPGDAQALAAAILRVLKDRPLASSLGEAARRRAEEVFDQRLVFARVREEYRRLLAQKGIPWP